MSVTVGLQVFRTPAGRVGGQDCDGSRFEARALFGHCPPGQQAERVTPTGGDRQINSQDTDGQS